LTIRIGINGFGRIGRNVFRAAYGRENIEIVAVNNRSTGEILPHLLKYDSVHGIFPHHIELTEDGFTVGKDLIKVVSHTDPGDIPWGELGVDVVIDGRQPTWSIGATLRDMMNVFLEYDAVEAANLDGGSSSEMVYNGKVMNKLWNIFGERYIPTGFVVMP